jgi:hypothetical protein
VSNFLHLWPALFAPFIWILVTFIISRLGGWSLLAKVYLAQESKALDGESWRFQSIQMRWATNYGNCVTVRADPLGLSLSVPFLFRIGHPPLLIPWSDIAIHRVRRSRFFPSLIELRFRLEPSIPVRVNHKLFSKILDSSDRYYPDFRHISPALDSPSLPRIGTGDPGCCMPFTFMERRYFI